MLLLGRKMRYIAIHGVAWFVCMSVCVSVGHVSSASKTAEPIEMPFGRLTHVYKKPCIIWGCQSLMGRGILGGCPPHWKAYCQSLLHRTLQKVNNGITAPLLLRTAMLPNWQCPITLSPWKIRHPAMQPFVKSIWSLVLSFNTQLWTQKVVIKLAVLCWLNTIQYSPEAVIRAQAA